MASATYIKYELLRTVRNKRSFIFSLIFPVVMYFLLALPNRNNHNFGGTPQKPTHLFAPQYYMLGLLAFVLLRLEDDPVGAETVARVTERFVDDMDGQLRQIGIGDIIVGKHIGKMMSMLGGRLGAYRDGLAAGDLDGALVRNLYRSDPPPPEALAHVRHALTALHGALAGVPISILLSGDLP